MIYYDKNNYEAYVRLGILYASARNFIEAHDAFNKAIKLNPSIIMAYKYLGDLCYGAGRYSEADSSYTNYFSKAEVSTDDEERYSLIMFFDKNYDKADSLMEQVIKKMPDNPVLFRIRGYIAYETGNYKNGLNYMNQFFRIQKNPDKIIASDYEYLGKLYLKNSMDSLGIINLEKSIALDSNKVYNYLEIANIYSKKENHIKAAEYYRKVKTSSPQEELNNSFRLGTECFYAGTQFKADYDTLKSSEAKQQNIPQEQILSLQQNYVKYLNQADSCFSIVASLSTKSHLGYLWKARAKSLLDPESMTDSAKNTYDKVLSLISPDDQTKYKKVIIECYRYFGSYYFFHSDREKKTDPAASRSDKKMAKDYFEKILSLDTNDQQAQIVLKALNQPE